MFLRLKEGTTRIPSVWFCKGGMPIPRKPRLLLPDSETQRSQLMWDGGLTVVCGQKRSQELQQSLQERMGSVLVTRAQLRA